MAESGYPGFEAIGWAAVLAPRDTPPAVTDYLSKQIGHALGTPEMQKFLRDRGAEPMPLTPEATGTFIASEVDKWGKAVKQSGAQVD